MINGYYLATNKATGITRVIYISGHEVAHISLTAHVVKSIITEWKDFIGPITYDLFEGLIQDIKTLRDNGDFSNGNTHPDNPSGPDEGEYMVSGFVANLIKRISPQND